MKPNNVIHGIAILAITVIAFAPAKVLSAETSVQIERPIVVVIDSKSADWKEVSQAFEKGSVIRIQYVEGEWRSNPSHAYHGPSGSAVKAPHDGYKKKDLPEGALLLRIEGQPIRVCPEGDIRITKDLVDKSFFFVMNDQDYKDNEGKIRLHIGTPTKAVIKNQAE